MTVRGERHLRAPAPQAAGGRGRAARLEARAAARSISRARGRAIPASSRAASSSAWPWRARSCSNPDILLLDEPLSNLDAKIRVQVRGGDPAAPAGARHHHHLRHARPGGGAVALRPRGRHEATAACSRVARPRSCTSGPATASWPTSSAPTTWSPGMCRERGDQEPSSSTPLGRLRAMPDGAVAGSAACSPSGRRTSPSAAAARENGNVVAGRVALASYLGNTLRYDVETAGGLVLKVDVARPLAPRTAADRPAGHAHVPGLGALTPGRWLSRTSDAAAGARPRERGAAALPDARRRGRSGSSCCCSSSTRCCGSSTTR